MNDFILTINWLVYIICLFVLLVPYCYSVYKLTYWRRKGIKGPSAIPFIGNFFTPFKPIALSQIDYLNKYGKFFGLYQGLRPILSISDPLIIKRILVEDFHIFRNRIKQPIQHKIVSQNLITVRDEKWKRIRSILSPMFTISKLKKMEKLMGKCTDSMMKALNNIADKDQSFLVYAVMGNFSMDVIARCAFATDIKAHSEVENIFITKAKKVFSFNMIRTLILFFLPGFLQSLTFKLKIPYFYDKDIEFFLDISSHLINQRRNNPSIQVEDMLQLMIKAKHGTEKNYENDMFDAHHVNVGKEEIENEKKIFRDIVGSKYLYEDEITAQSIIFFLAGYETTASAMTYCIYELAKHPDIQEKLYKEIKSVSLDYNSIMRLPYLDAVFSETLRIHSPVLVLSREASEDYYIPEYDYKLKKDDAIIIPIYAVHHSPKYYKDPETFDPERFMSENRNSIVPYTYLPFGGGPRNCIGMRFALSEAKLGLVEIIKNFIIYKSDETCRDLKVVHSSVLLKTIPIYVRVKRRQSSD